jgi:oxalate decarboxylase
MTATDPLVFLGLFRSDRFAELSLNQWMALVPPELVKAHLNLDDATIAALRTDKQVVARP